MLSVRLFGLGQASYAGQPLAGFPSQQPCLVLAYLLLNRSHLHSRESLAALFWPDYMREASLKALRNALWRLRQTMLSAGVPNDQYLAVGEDRIAFSVAHDYWLDIETFERLVKQSLVPHGVPLTSEQASDLEQAVSLYSGDLLEGIDFDWCLVEREHLRGKYLHALSALMAYHEANKNFACGLAYGESILARDPTRESIHRRMMRLYWLSGDRGAAVGQYHRCAQILQDELGIGPMPQTQRLYHRLVHDCSRPSVQPRAAAACSDSRPKPQAKSEAIVADAVNRIRQLQDVIAKTTAELARLERAIQDLKR